MNNTSKHKNHKKLLYAHSGILYTCLKQTNKGNSKIPACWQTINSRINKVGKRVKSSPYGMDPLYISGHLCVHLYIYVFILLKNQQRNNTPINLSINKGCLYRRKRLGHRSHKRKGTSWMTSREAISQI